MCLSKSEGRSGEFSYFRVLFNEDTDFFFFFNEKTKLIFFMKIRKVIFQNRRGGGVVADLTLTPNSTAEADPLPEYIQSVANMCNPHQRIVELTS